MNSLFHRQRRRAIGTVVLLVDIFLGGAANAEQTVAPLFRTVDLAIDESHEVVLSDGRKTTVTLVAVAEFRDPIRDAIRRARVRLVVDEQAVELGSGNYELPKIVGGVQIDCPVTGGYRRNAQSDVWGLKKDARLRLWPAGSPWIRPGTFVYPLRQRWFASSTQMSNEPAHVTGSELPSVRKIYYHYGLDIGGAEGSAEVVAATDGLVMSSGGDTLPGQPTPGQRPRYDMICIRDQRGWYYGYNHMHTIDEAIRPGVRVRAGQRLGLLGKKGVAGGWSHLHFEIVSPQPSGRWGNLGVEDAYAFVWEAYQRKYQPKLIAVARPHHLALTGEKITLDASRSWSAAGAIAGYRWTFTDGTTAEGITVGRTYNKAGYYSEALRVADTAGRVEYDFTTVGVLDREQTEPPPPAIHLAYAPTFDIKPGDNVTFKVRTFLTTDGEETWNFGDGSPTQTTRSDGGIKALAPDGYAILAHRFARPGHYVVRVERSDSRGRRAIGHVAVKVEAPERFGNRIDTQRTKP